MTEKDLPALSIADLQSMLRRREVSPREVVDALRARIEACAEGKYCAAELEGTPPGIVLRGIDFRDRR